MHGGTRPRARRQSPLLTTLALVILAITLLGNDPSPVRGTALASPAKLDPLIQSGPVPPASTAWNPAVAYTLGVFSGGIFPGDSQPANGEGPGGVAYDSGNGEVYIQAVRNNAVVVLNASSLRVVKSIYVPLTASCCLETGIIADPALHEVFVAELGGDSVAVINDQTNSVVRTIKVGYDPMGLILDNQTSTLFVPDAGSNRVSVINASNQTAFASISSCVKPVGGTFDPIQSIVFVTCWGSGKVQVINATSLTRLGYLAVGTSPDAAAYDSLSGLVYVANAGSGNFTIIQPSNSSIVGSSNAGNGPVSVVFDSVDDLLLTSDQGSATYQAFNATSLARVYADALTGTLFSLDFDSTLHRVFLGCVTGGNVTVYNPVNGTIIGIVWTQAMPWGATYVSGASRLFVSERSIPQVAAIDPFNGTETNITVGSVPMGIAYDPGTGRVFVANSGSDNVSVISPSKLSTLTTYPVGSLPQGLIDDPANGNVYVANSNSNNISVLNASTGHLVASIAVGSYPFALAYDPINSRVYVANDYSDNVSVISTATNSVLTSISLGSANGPLDLTYDSGARDIAVVQASPSRVWFLNTSTNSISFTNTAVDLPYGIGYDPVVGDLLVSEPGFNNASIINASSGPAIANLPLGETPREVTYAPTLNAMLVVNQDTASVSVITASISAYNVTFVPHGLSPSEQWQVTIGGQPLTSNATSISYRLPNGTYAYSIQAPPGLSVVPARGNVTIAGSAVNVSVNFSTEYEVSFVPSNLTTGWKWAVQLNGTEGTAISPGDVRFNLTNGSYSFQVNVSSRYHPNPGSGGFTVSGAPLNLTISFAESTFQLRFVAFGKISVGTNWSVDVNGTNHSTAADDLDFNLPNGTYTFAIGAPPGLTAHPARGSVPVIGVPQQVNVTFLPVPVYKVRFSEVGLPAGTNWTVTLNGSSQQSTVAGPTDSFNWTGLPNGTYSYTMGGIPGWHEASLAYEGNVTVNGSNVTISVGFVEVGYAVTFSESGLPVGLNWGVTVGGLLQQSESDGGVVSLLWSGIANGTYSYSIASLSGWRQATLLYSGSVTVGGVSVTEPQLAYSRVNYSVRFNETGLPMGTAWGVELSDAWTNVSTMSLAVALPNGSYEFGVGSVAGWTPSVRSGPIIVNGTNVSQTVVWTVTRYTVTFGESGLPVGTGWAVAIQGSPENSDSDSIQFELPNGTFGFQVSPIPGYRSTSYGGPIQVAGQGKSISVQWSQTTYRLTATAVGLPTSIGWGITIQGQTLQSVSGNVTVELPNGTYSVLIEAIPGWQAGSYETSITVAGAPIDLNLTWTQVLYEVGFEEHGLPLGENWTVNVGAEVLRAGAAATVAVRLPNGTYPYTITVEGPVLVSVVNGSGEIVVDGNTTWINVTVNGMSTGPLPKLANQTSGAGSPWEYAVVGLIVIVGLAGGLGLWWRRRTRDRPPSSAIAAASPRDSSPSNIETSSR
jgi:YVTN family beta-propeller protein